MAQHSDLYNPKGWDDSPYTPEKPNNHHSKPLGDPLSEATLAEIRALNGGYDRQPGILPWLDYLRAPIDTPFLQPRDAKGFIDWISHIGGRETLHEEMLNKVANHLPPSQLRTWEAEEKAIKDYESALTAWQKGHRSGERPITPLTPTHDYVEILAKQQEEKLRDKVLARMTPERRTELERELSSETGSSADPHSALKQYSDLIKKAVESY